MTVAVSRPVLPATSVAGLTVSPTLFGTSTVNVMLAVPVMLALVTRSVPAPTLVPAVQVLNACPKALVEPSALTVPSVEGKVLPLNDTPETGLL